MTCPRCHKRTLYRSDAQPEYGDEGQPTGTLRVIYECVQCDGQIVTYEKETT